MAITKSDVSTRLSTIRTGAQTLVDFLNNNNLEYLTLTDIESEGSITFDPGSIEYTVRDGFVVPVGEIHPNIQVVYIRSSDRENSDIGLGLVKDYDLPRALPFDGTDRNFATWDGSAPGGGSGPDHGVGK